MNPVEIQNKFKHTWRNVVNRCTKKYDSRYYYYSKKGISKEWLTYKNFEIDMLSSYIDHIIKYGIKDTSIDRIDNNLGYSKENCRWATREVQSENSRNKRVNCISIICKFCKKIFLTKNRKRIFCSTKCNGKFHRKWSGETVYKRNAEYQLYKYNNDIEFKKRVRERQRKYFQRKMAKNKNI